MCKISRSLALPAIPRCRDEMKADAKLPPGANFLQLNYNWLETVGVPHSYQPCAKALAALLRCIAYPGPAQLPAVLARGHVRWELESLKLQLAAGPCSSFLCEQHPSTVWLQQCCWFQLCVLTASPLHVAHRHFLVSRSGISPSGICHHCICTHFVKGKLFGCSTGRVLCELKNMVDGFSSAPSIKLLPILSQIDTSHYVMTCLLEMTLLLCTTISDMSSSNEEKY